MTIDGYHPSFTIPNWYPILKRLAISWQYDSTISISGDAYFAIKPKFIMGGGSLNFIYTSSPLQVVLHAHADLFMNFEPFHYVADVRVSCTLGIGILSETFDLDIAASINLYIPPVAGLVRIDYVIFSF